MTILTKTSIAAVIVALAASPAMAHEPRRPSSDGTERTENAKNPGPKAGFHAKARAYGRYCRSFSKERIGRRPGTPFARCVVAMARLGSGRTDSPRFACRHMSKRHIRGQKGTPFSRCVVAGAQLLRDLRSESAPADEETESPAEEESPSDEQPSVEETAETAEAA